MCSIMPKKGYFTITLIGGSVDDAASRKQNLELIKSFLATPRIRRILPGGAALEDTLHLQPQHRGRYREIALWSSGGGCWRSGDQPSIQGRQAQGRPYRRGGREEGAQQWQSDQPIRPGWRAARMHRINRLIVLPDGNRGRLRPEIVKIPDSANCRAGA